MLLAISILSSCKKENDPQIIIPEIKIEVESNSQKTEISIPEDSTLILKAIVNNSIEYKSIWSVDNKEVSTEKIFKFLAKGIGEHIISLKVINNDGGESTTALTVSVYGKYKHGTFILNEGNMTSEQGSLIFISPNRTIIDSVYWRENKSFLGNVTQDIFITNNKIYIISQNGKADGKLVIANAETLKKEIGYDSELSKLSWPTHLVVVENKAYIRDNNGVYIFDLNTKELNYIEGTQGVAKNRMALIDKKVFVYSGKKIFVIKDNSIIHTIELDGNISGIIKTTDKNLYVSCTTNPATILKINSSDYSIIKKNEIIDAKVGCGWGATPGISAKGDTIYFSNATTKIYRHLFSQNKTEYLADVKEYIENAGIVYNNLAVHPLTGEVYFNTIKGFGLDFLINNISVFNFSGSKPTLVSNYKDYTHFPAGIFFTDNF